MHRPYVYLSVLLLSVALTLGKPSPQDVSADDVFGGDDEVGNRDAGYSQTGNQQGNDDLVSEVFGVQGDKGTTQNHEPVGNYEENNNLGSDYVPPAKQTVDDSDLVCADYEDQGYHCVDFLQCTEEGEIITGGQGIIDKRSNFGNFIEIDYTNSKCEHSLEVCCRHPDFSGEPVRPKPKPYSSRCGNHNINGIGVRIQNYPEEASTEFGEWPHMCAVLEVKNGRNLYVSGASLIAPDLVLTAAHSVEKYAKNQDQYSLIVRCGEWDTQRTLEPAEHQDREVYYINSHPGFSSKNLTNNVALLHVSEQFILSPHVDVICLGDDYEYDGCVATGWGKDDFGASGRYQVVMKQVELNVVERDTCENALRTTRLGKFFNLDQTALCAGGYSGVDTCKGDGGGPLVCPIKGSIVRDAYSSPSEVPQYVQAGIVGWGIGCGEDGVPGVYTDINNYNVLCFINEATKCVLGQENTYFFGNLDCDRWLDDEYDRLDYAIESYRYQAEYAEGKRQRLVADRRLKEHLAEKAAYDLWSSKCGTFGDNDNFEEYGNEDGYNVDISEHTRINEGVGQDQGQ